MTQQRLLIILLSMSFTPSLTALRALKNLETTGSVSRTAQELGLTQSAISRSIANLEKASGLRFFRRDVRPLEFTAVRIRLNI